MQNFNQSVIKHKTGLLNLAAELGNISRACRIMSFPEIPFHLPSGYPRYEWPDGELRPVTENQT